MDLFQREEKGEKGEKLYLYTCYESGTPQRYEVKDSFVIGYGSSVSVSDGRLLLDHPLLEEKQGEMTRHIIGGWQYKNWGVENESWFNGERMQEQQTVEIHDNDAVRITGDTIVTFVFSVQGDEEVEWKCLALNDDFPVVHIRSYQPQKEMEEADLAVEETEREEAAKTEDRHHARIRKTEEGWLLEDIHTSRGLYVNGERVLASRLIQPMDVICAGDTLFLFRGDHLLYNHRTLKRKNLEIHIEERIVQNFLKKHVLLKDIDLNITSGNMVLLLGGSGAGKTTFINAVTGYEKAKAQILHGGENLYENYDRLKYEIAMVPQQDLLRGEDSVRMTLVNAAELRMPVNISEEDREKRVDEVLEMFGLLEEKDNLVEKLSGGQRKRLSIGVEFISDPSLFILDEPDSGLDGVMARELMERLRQIADQNRIVIVITHTPDRVIDLFDQVIVLAKSAQDHTGHLAFFGSIEEARRFFGRDSMEEIVRAVSAESDGGDGLADQFIEQYRKQQEERGN